MRRFEGRVALVTGGASGIGGAIVDRLIDEGARAVVWDIDAAKLAASQTRYGDAVTVARVDVSDPDAVSAAAAAMFADDPVLDILVNAAGVVGPNGPFWQATPEEWRRVTRVNLDGPFLVARAVTPVLIERGWGRIVNVASVTAAEGPKALGPYAASKAGLVGLTKSMGRDLAGTGVLVNAIAPALIATELLAQLSPEYYAAALARIPLGRAGTLAEVASLVTWLCSDEMSFSTGAVFDLSGGRGN